MLDSYLNVVHCDSEVVQFVVNGGDEVLVVTHVVFQCPGCRPQSLYLYMLYTETSHRLNNKETGKLYRPLVLVQLTNDGQNVSIVHQVD